MTDPHIRDLVGYALPPAANWPGGARLAVNFVLNIEEGRNIGGSRRRPHETGLAEVTGGRHPEGVRDLGWKAL